MKKLITLKTILLIFALISYSLVYAQVGIGTTTPTTTLDVDGAVSLRDGGALALTGAVLNNNLTLPLTAGKVYSNYRITVSGAAGSFGITGFIPVAGVDGQIIIIQNTTNRAMLIFHNNANSAAANRIFVPGEKTLELTGRYSSVTLMYSDAQNRWIVQNKLSDETTYFTAPQNIAPSTIYNLTYPIAACTSTSSVSVNLLGDWSLATQPWEDITIHHVEARTGEVRFVIVNSSFGTTYTGMDFVISVRN